MTMTRRVLVSYLTITVFVLLVLEIPLAVFFAERERDRFTAGVESDATVLAGLYEDVLDQGAPLDSSPADAYASDTGSRVIVVDEQGISILDTAAEVPRDFSTRPEVVDALGGLPSSGTRRSETLGAGLLYVAVPVASGGQVHGAVRVTLPTSDVDARVRRFWIGLVGMGVVILAAMALVGWTLARSVTSPLRRLERTAEAFAHGDLTPRPVPREDPAEVRQLGEALNVMAAQLTELLASQRAFVTDASHQLRTPLTALRLRLENLDDAVESSRHAELDAAVDEIERLAELVGQLLQLARAEQPPAGEPIDLVGLARDRVDTWSAVAADAGVELALDVPTQPAVAVVAPGSAEQILDNLVDNAVAVAPDGTRVTVRVVAGDANHELHVVDEGPGLSDDDKRRALDRFWRGSSHYPGTGLGLPIVVELVRAHGGTLTLVDAPGGGLDVTVTLPAGPDRAPVASRSTPMSGGSR